MRHYVALSLAVTIFLVPWAATTFPETADRLAVIIRDVSEQVAAVVVHNPRTVAGLQQKYAASTNQGTPRVRILLVPGHEPTYGGAEFGSLKERTMTVDLAEQLGTFLSANTRYEVIIVRDKQAWNPIFTDYFKKQWEDIIAWQKSHQQESLRKVAITPLPPPKVYHNKAPSDVAYRLYGMTKWSNENMVDIAVHIHFNDYPRKATHLPGKYSGFAIYTPEKQYANGTTTRAVSEAVFKRLAKYNPVSDLPGEIEGIIDERELIAVGANDTADAASLLIEYGYIYEPQFTNSEAYPMAIKDLAFQTYLGLEDFFTNGRQSSLAAAYDTLALPYTWRTPLSDTTAHPRDVFALQTALLADGVYPPASKTKNDCPRTGKIGPCTKASIEVFQKKYGIDEKGFGEKTLQELNRRYSGRVL